MPFNFPQEAQSPLEIHPTCVQTSDTLYFSFPQAVIHGHPGSVDHKQKSLP